MKNFLVEVSKEKLVKLYPAPFVDTVAEYYFGQVFGFPLAVETESVKSAKAWPVSG